MDILLLHPPQAKPGEPPAGIPLLTGSLRSHGFTCAVCDLNREGLDYLLSLQPTPGDTWGKRAFKNRIRHRDSLYKPETYLNRDRYTRAVSDLNRVLEICGTEKGISLSLTNYQDETLSPLRSEDLLRCAENYRENIFYRLIAGRLQELIERYNPRHIGISINFLSQALPAFALAGFLRDRYPEIPLIAGGGLVTTWISSSRWKSPFPSLFSHMVCGPGEMELIRLLGKEPSTLRSCPDYSDLAQYSYLAPGLILPYATSTGCFWRKCSFCPETSEKNPFTPVAAESVVAELQQSVARYNPVLIHLVDNAIRPAILQQLIDQPPGAPWYGFVRFTDQLADPDFCRKLRQSGCTLLKLGLESGSQPVLDRMSKGIHLSLASRALKALHDAGIMTYVYLLFGTPPETESDAELTLEFVRSHHLEITYLNLAIFNMPIGSDEVSELAVSDFYEGDLSIYTDFHHPMNWNRKAIRRFLDNRFKRVKEIHSILKNDPLHFTSNHAALFSHTSAN